MLVFYLYKDYLRVMTTNSKWKARTKRDLMIEVWEYLDCESVGAKELEAIMEAVRDRFGEGALESPASIARLLADEGAELRHAEILELDVKWRFTDPYQAMFRNILKFSSFEQAASSIRRLENLRKQFERTKDEEGLRRLREEAVKGKRRTQMISRNQKVNEKKRAEKEEMARWFIVWLETPEIFEEWLDLRLRSEEFRKQFQSE
jgi:hypothetical protein